MTLALIILLFLLGLITGFYSGLLGTGGNIILIPALDVLFLYLSIDGMESVRFIIAHSLFITVFLGMAISYKQYKIGNFYLKEVLTIGIPGMISAFLLTEIIKSSDLYDKLYFDIVFLSLLILLAVRLLFFRSKGEDMENSNGNNINATYLIGLGVLTGCVTALSGLGGGIVLIPFLTDVMKNPIKKASSISIGVIMLLAIAVSGSYLFVNDGNSFTSKLPMQIGYVSIYIVLPVLLGIFLASSFGVKVAQRASPIRLRIIFGIVVVLLCIKMTSSLLMS